MKIFADTPLSGPAVKLLQEGVAPHQITFSAKPAGSVLAKSDTDAAFADADIAFGQPDIGDIPRSTRLRWMHLTSAGYTRYDTREFREAAAGRGLLVTNSSTVYAQPCAEHLFAFMLAQSRGLPRSLASESANGSGEWFELRRSCKLLLKQNVVILGFGAIAVKLIEMLRPFEMNIVALRRKPKGNEKVSIINRGELSQALKGADHVINILPANEETIRFVSSDLLTAMKPGAIFYNIGRGTTVDQDALAHSLRSGHLGAAWLDVTEPEPLPTDHPLRSMRNCFITPHTGGGQEREDEALIRHFLNNFHRFVAGSPLVDQIM